MSDAERVRLTQAAVVALSRGDRAAARRLAGELLAGDGDDPNACQVLGVLALEAGEIAAARAHLERANASAPDKPSILNALGVTLRRAGELARARECLARAGELGSAEAWRNLGNLEGDAGQAAAALKAYEAALKLEPGDPCNHASLASALEQAHQLARAKAHAQRALALDPRSDIARLALARVLLREGDFDGVTTTLVPVTANPNGSKTNQAIAWGLIGDGRDKAGAPREAFQAFTAANRLLLELHGGLRQATHLAYHPEGVRRMLRFVEGAAAPNWRAPEASVTPAPAFLVGFPRSGTTLLDQVLSSHSEVACLEEKEIFAGVLAEYLRPEEGLTALAAAPPQKLETLRAEYWRRWRAETGEEVRAGVLVDKLPLNLIFLPLIRRVFPDAKIIFALRDPRDVVLSCFQQRFGMNAAMAQFLELESAAAYYDLVMQLYEHTRDRFNPHVLVVRYEDVVADLESQARALAAFLDLSFQPAMLEYYATAAKRIIQTPSASQVIQPLYTNSVGRWRAYAEDLAPMLPLVERWVRRFGYAP